MTAATDSNSNEVIVLFRKRSFVIDNSLQQKMEGDYPDGEVEDVLMAKLTMDELKTAFRLFDENGEGFIRVDRFRVSVKLIIILGVIKTENF